MPVELSDLLNKKRWIPVEIGEHIINIAYRPAATSLRRQAELQRKAREMQAATDADELEQVKQVGSVFCEIICDWDLTDHGQPMPVNVETVTALPGAIYNAIMEAVTNDRQSGGTEEKKLSSVRLDDGLLAEARRESVQNGIPSFAHHDTWAQ